jgi:carboxyl-terminal processing protease
MRARTWSTVVLLSTLVVSACGGGRPQPTQPSEMSAQARAYLNEVIGLMQAHSINRGTVDWSNLRTTVFREAPNAQIPADTYPAIRLAFKLIGDVHGSYRTASGFVVNESMRSCSGSDPGTVNVPPTIGYVKVPTFGGIGPEATAYATGLQQTIMAADRDDLAGWIVDVRGNLGGNMWPMIAGVGPVLGEGVFGYFIDPTGVENVLEYRDGGSWDSGVVQQRVDAPYRLRRERPRVAVLTNGLVASSGEATVLAFRARPDARSFGTPTCGLSTAVENYPMSDGAMLNLAVSYMADRTKTKYGFVVAPDEVVSDPGEAVERAIAWLRSAS